MPYDWGKLPNRLPGIWVVYSQMFGEFSAEIANIVNELTRYTHQLTAWRDVIAKLDDDQRLSVSTEFVVPLATVAINLPYVIRSRYIFATAHLCHQANLAKQRGDWKDDLSLDNKICFDEANKCGSHWGKYKNLKLSLERIGDKSYQSATNDFRNAYNHRFSPRIVIGITNFVTRHVEKATGKVSYSLGGIGPLSLENIVQLLEQQCINCYKAFECFKKLVREHESAIAASI